MTGDEKFQKWRAMNVDELKAFLGFLILMAIIHHSERVIGMPAK